MRVIAGVARSLPLKCPAGTQVRPTTDRIKETLFNILQNDVPGAVFVDVCAGSGAIGIEALSRGAKKAYFIEKDKNALAVIEDNLKFTKLDHKASVIKGDVLGALHSVREDEAHLIFIDPPYHEGLEEGIFQELSNMKYVTKDTLIVLEAELDKETDFLQNTEFEVIREKRYKTNKHLFIQYKK